VRTAGITAEITVGRAMQGERVGRIAEGKSCEEGSFENSLWITAGTTAERSLGINSW
jgi:hypothetical protein